MAKAAIPETVRREVEAIVARFNKEVLGENLYGVRAYIPRYRGKHLYLDRSENGRIGEICRLTFKGAMNTWGFAIFKYSKMRYDPEEWLFPGYDHVDGTLEGAMRAGLEAYP